jgi:hypothetical protein
MAPPGPAEWDSYPCPRILTVHGNGKPGEKFPLNSVFLSEDHASRHGGNVFVHNGIDPDELIYARENRMDRYLFLSRTG